MGKQKPLTRFFVVRKGKDRNYHILTAAQDLAPLIRKDMNLPILEEGEEFLPYDGIFALKKALEKEQSRGDHEITLDNVVDQLTSARVLMANSADSTTYTPSN